MVRHAMTESPWLTVPEVSAANLKNGLANPEDFMKMRVTGRSCLLPVVSAMPGRPGAAALKAQATFSHS